MPETEFLIDAKDIRAIATRQGWGYAATREMAFTQPAQYVMLLREQKDAEEMWEEPEVKAAIEDDARAQRRRTIKVIGAWLLAAVLTAVSGAGIGWVIK